MLGNIPGGLTRRIQGDHECAPTEIRVAIPILTVKLTQLSGNFMAKCSTDKLYVNLSASQTRKRLKGHGFGVRQVEASGRRQAVITHTATGAHLRELESLFADVMPSASPQPLGIPVEKLKNIGPTSAGWLREIGVFTNLDLERLGPIVAYRLVKQREVGISLNFLWAMVGALSNRDWRELPSQEKTTWLAELEQ